MDFFVGLRQLDRVAEHRYVHADGSPARARGSKGAQPDAAAGSALFGDGQLGLFGAPPPTDPYEALRPVAESLPAEVRFGTSSWTYPGWHRIVYHQSYKNRQVFTRESLREYARHPLLRAVGRNRSFYSPLEEEELVAYGKQLPDDFSCLAKVWTDIAARVFPRHHAKAGQLNRAFLDPEAFLPFGAPFQKGLGERLGPFLVEVPPAPGPVNPVGFARRIDAFLKALKGEGYRFAFELRDARLMSPAYADVLHEHGAAHVYNSWTHMPDLLSQHRLLGGLESPFTVLRLMLPPGHSHMEMKKRCEPFDRLVAPQLAVRSAVKVFMAAAQESGRPLHVLVSNNLEGCAPRTVEAMATAWHQDGG